MIKSFYPQPENSEKTIQDEDLQLKTLGDADVKPTDSKGSKVINENRAKYLKKKAAKEKKMKEREKNGIGRIKTKTQKNGRQ
jgi:hypothetical protein